ncbi:MAG: xylulokinase [Sphaerochaetaceae bacterium]|nr:xylulokinase [Sphaerochaetaceae bacterium]
MNRYIGIDLGTSSVKVMLVDENGAILGSESAKYPLSFPHPGWSEQNPEDWWNATKECLTKLFALHDPSAVKGIGVGGQMHGLVVLDEADRVIRPAILWNDGRTEKEVEYLNQVIGKDKISAYTANIAFAGFTAPKILWMKANEPKNYSRIRKVMLPKDYINYCLTGVHACDYSDASGMLLLDVENRCWSKPMLELCGLSESVMPKLVESFESIGSVSEHCSKEFGLPTSVVVAGGAGDNAAAAVGTGVVGEGGCNISLGTSGTVFISSEKFKVDPNNALHAFAHADGGYHLMGCMLSAASCNQWFYEQILKTTDYKGIWDGIQDERLGENRVFFLPYLMGERSPINDVNARGTFVGLSMDCSREDMAQAVMEGVAFAIRDSFEVAWSLGIKVQRSFICGGGARSELWRKILANVLGITLVLPKSEEGPGMGGAMLAMVASKAYPTVSACVDALCCENGVVTPDAQLTAKYEERYQVFRKIYPTMKNLFKEMTR